MPRHPSKQAQPGFTFVELVVSMTIAVVLVAITIPMVDTIKKDYQRAAGENTIVTAVATARGYATRDVADLETADDTEFAGFTYSGAAAVFTPAGEIRIVENDQEAIRPNDAYLEALDFTGGTADRWSQQNGYRDIPNQDYFRLAQEMGVVGLTRGGNPASVMLLAPPFAIRFDPHGVLIQGQPTSVSSHHRGVYYDANLNGKYSTSRDRTDATNYNPDLWNPAWTKPKRVSNPSNTYEFKRLDDGRYTFPFEALEAVLGVVVFSDSELRKAGLDLTADPNTGTGINEPAQQWILNPDHGKVILFDRYSGRALRKGDL